MLVAVLSKFIRDSKALPGIFGEGLATVLMAWCLPTTP